MAATALPQQGSSAHHRRRLLRKVAGFSMGICGLILGAREFSFTGPVRQPEPLPAEPILDVHCHVAGLGAGNSGCFISPALRDNWRFGFYLQAFGVDRAELEREGDALLPARLSERLAASGHVAAAVILAMDGVVDTLGQLDRQRTEFYVPNEFVLAACRRHTNLLYGASINPYRSDALERLDQAARDGAVLIKWLPSIQHIDPADPRIDPFYQRLVELDLPLLTHTGAEKSFTRSEDALADPLRLERPLRLGVRVIAAHVATTGEHEGERDLDRLARLMPRYTNLWADISSLTQLNKLGYLNEILRRPEFEGRLVYGSDFPLIAMPLASPWYFPLNLRVAEMRRLASVPNPWERDVRLKQALGVPAAIFKASRQVIRQPRLARDAVSNTVGKR